MAKNKKAGLGRGLNSLLGGYEAPAEPVRVAPERQTERAEAQAAPVAEVAPVAPAPVVEREVIREEDIAREADRRNRAVELAHCGERCGGEDGAHRRARWRNY